MSIVLERLYPEKEQVKRLYDHCNEQFRLQPIEKDLLKFIKQIYLVFPPNQHHQSNSNYYSSSKDPFESLRQLDQPNGYISNWRLISNILGEQQLLLLWNSCSIYQQLPNNCFLQLNSIRYPIASNPKLNNVGRSLGQHQEMKQNYLEKGKLFYSKPILSYKTRIGSSSFVKFEIFRTKFDSIQLFLQEIFGKKGSRSRFVKSQTEIFETIMKRINKFPLKSFLDHCCGPIEESWRELGLTELHSNSLSQPNWVYELMVAGKSISATRLNTDPFKVFLLLRAILLKIFGRSFFGKNNWKIIFKNLRQFVELKKNEGIRWNQLMFRVRPSEIQFNHYSKQQNYHLTCEQYSHRLIWWIFDSFVCSAMRNCFYLTESTIGLDGRQSDCYFRHDLWLLITASYTNTALFQSTFVALKNHQKVEARRTALSGRLIPKANGFRLITNCSHSLTPNGKSLNQIMAPLLPIFYWLINRANGLQGASVLNHYQIYERILAYRQRLKRTGKIGSTLYFAKVDLKNCFDSINQDKLWSIIERIFDEKIPFKLKKYSIQDTLKRTFKQMAFDKPKSFVDFVSNLIELKQQGNSVYKVEGNPISIDKGEILRLLKQLIFDSYLKCPFSSEYWERMVGIPQGSVLSTVLCSIYYGDFEQKACLINPHRDELIMRYVDDYLFISTDKQSVQYFLSLFDEPNSEYNFTNNKQKQETNLHQPSLQFIEWCGIEFDLKEFSPKVPHVCHGLSCKCHEPTSSCESKKCNNTSQLESIDKIPIVNRQLPFSIHSKIPLLKSLESKLFIILRLKLLNIFLDGRLVNSRLLKQNLKNAFQHCAIQFFTFFCKNFKLNPQMYKIFHSLVLFSIKLYRWKRKNNPNLLKFVPQAEFIKFLVENFVEEAGREGSKFAKFKAHLEKRLEQSD